MVGCTTCATEVDHLRRENQLLSRQVQELQFRLDLEKERSNLWKEKYDLIDKALGKSDDAMKTAVAELKLNDQIKSVYKLEIETKNKQIASLKSQRKWAFIIGGVGGVVAGWKVGATLKF